MHIRTLPALGVLAATALVLTGCAGAQSTTATKTTTPTPSPTAAHWGYEGVDDPAHWASLSGDYRECSAGEHQSPIDLPALGHDAPLHLDVTHGDVDETTADNGHTVQLTVGTGETTVVDGVEFHLQQMHFHAASEHTVEGKRYPIEFHFVHADADGNLLVLAVFGKVGASNPAFDAFIEGAMNGATSARTESVDIAAMLPAKRSYWSYEGSLTTPPCTEGVHWVVLATPIELGQDQIDELAAIHHDNDRPTQDLNGRTVHSSAE